MIDNWRPIDVTLVRAEIEFLPISCMDFCIVQGKIHIVQGEIHIVQGEIHIVQGKQYRSEVSCIGPRLNQI